ncbi:WD1261 family protein [Wolbachia endosymbiont (group A) of Icerya purchasi]|uniref:WD1261 family protein n=1 Tax=Wolbachia endosymbiont (group A) of Icerya purchasi TaxID=2954019 RepID=UPI002231DC28|nr:hypothetical protein [Wolbachia endosymbiont (group A) of Icerya purchasi]
MVKEVEELIKIVGKGDLLETLFIFLGSFQHVGLYCNMDGRNHVDLPAFIRKEEEPLDKYFNLKFSLQGLFLIYIQAYEALVENTQLNTQEVIDKIYAAIENERMSTSHMVLKELLEEVIDRAELTEDQKKLKLLNVLANPKRNPVFETVEDFENKVFTDIKKLLNEKSDKEFYFNKFVIDCYYSIHQDIKVDRDVALLFSLLYPLRGSYKKPLSPDKIVKREVLGLGKSSSILSDLTGILRCIDLPNENGSTKYTLNYKGIGELNKILNIIADQDNQDFLTFKSIGPTLKQLLKKQNSNKFEERIINNTYYSAPQKENECRPDFIISKKKDHKNTVCKLILGMFVLSIGLSVADYFFMEQKLLNSIKDVLPQNNLTNLIVAAVLTIVVVYALFQLLKSPQEPPLSTVDDVQNKKLEPFHAKQA